MLGILGTFLTRTGRKSQIPSTKSQAWRTRKKSEKLTVKYSNVLYLNNLIDIVLNLLILRYLINIDSV